MRARSFIGTLANSFFFFTDCVALQGISDGFYREFQKAQNNPKFLAYFIILETYNFDIIEIFLNYAPVIV